MCVCQSSENVSDLFGIGAITDASAVFAKLTKENQQEFLMHIMIKKRNWLLHNQNYYS
jgi:hypothetical protein